MNPKQNKLEALYIVFFEKSTYSKLNIVYNMKGTPLNYKMYPVTERQDALWEIGSNSSKKKKHFKKM